MNKMRKKFLILFIVNILFFLLVLGIYAVGYEYDKAHKLYPESIQVGYDISIVGFGQRWVRFTQIMILVGVIIDTVVGLTWYRETQKTKTNVLVLSK